MTIKELDGIRTKDGREATVLESYKNGKAFYVEFHNKDDDPTFNFINKEDIEVITYVYNKE